MSEQKSEHPGYIRRTCSQCGEGLGFTESDPCDKCSVSKPSVAEARELLPCPFCGASAGDIKLSRGHGFIIGCTSCQAQQFAMERTEAARLWNTRVDPASSTPELTARQVLRHALESEGSKVIFDSAANRVEWCPNDSRCAGTTDHQPECWLGQAIRLIPTVDTDSSITEKAQRAAEKIWNNLDRTWTVQEMVEIIAAEFQK